MKTEYVLTFKNTNFAIKAERFLLADKIKIGVMPLPSQISAGCGICLRISQDEIDRSLEVLKKNNINEIGLFLRSSENEKYFYEELNAYDRQK